MSPARPLAACSNPARLARTFSPSDRVASTLAMPVATPMMVTRLRQGCLSRFRSARRRVRGIGKVYTESPHLRLVPADNCRVRPVNRPRFTRGIMPSRYNVPVTITDEAVLPGPTASAPLALRPASMQDAALIQELYVNTPGYFEIISIPLPVLSETEDELSLALADERRHVEPRSEER